MKVILSGGGIGGLTAALCCLHHGHDVIVLEQASELSEVGAGIQIPPNAMKVFQALGIAGQIAETAFQPEAIETRMGESGVTLFKIPLADHAVKTWGAPYYHIHRADYIAALSAALAQRAPDAVRLGAAVTGYEQDEASVTAILANGERVTGDVLIGADGIHSPVRAQMLGRDQPVFTGNVAWRAVVPMEQLGADAPNPTACAWMGRGRHAVTYRLRRGTLANFVGVVERDDWTKEGWNEMGTAEEAMRDFAGWHPMITRILEEAGALYRWALFDRLPLKTWTQGRVALLGDAAHPMLPFLAQGAAMAVEDAWVIASMLSKLGRPAPTSLQAYQDRCFDRATDVQARSRANAKTFHKRTLAGRLSTYGPMWMAGKVAPGIVHNRMDDLYRHDVTANESA